MKIKEIGLYQYDEPFKLGFHSPQTLRSRAESIIVRLQFENGVSGYGECAPRTYVTGESCSTVVSVIKDFFSPVLFSYDITTTADIESVLDELESECLKSNIPHYNSALGAIDLAVLDALGKYQEVPVSDFLGPVVRKNIPYSIPIPFLPDKKIRELFSHFRQFEFESVKLLVGKNESENIRRASLVRSLFGDHVEIRIEANGKWTFDQAISNMEKLRKFDIKAVEQPVNDIRELQKFKKAVGIPVIVDESMCSLSDARNLVEREACDILNIKISKCGGLLRSKRIAAFAQAQNIPCHLGSHVGETEILSSAGKYFALTTSNLKCFEGGSFLLFEDSWRNSQIGTKRKDEDGTLKFGLGIGSANQESIRTRSFPIVELVGNCGIEKAGCLYG